MEQYLMLCGLAVVSFIQNMAFTASSRSRNSGDPMYHFWIAGTSNGIWFICHILVWKQIWDAVSSGNHYWLVVVGSVYIVCTSAGSSLMMWLMLRKESGKRRVGAKQST